MSADADEGNKHQPPCVGTWTFDASRLRYQPGTRESIEPGHGYDIWFSEASIPIPMPDVTGDYLTLTPICELDFSPLLNLGGSFPHSTYEAIGPPSGLRFRFVPPLIDFSAPTTPEEIEEANQRVANGGRPLEDDSHGDPDREPTEEHPLVPRPPPVPSSKVQAVTDLLGPTSRTPKEFNVPQPKPPAPNEPSRAGAILTTFVAFLFIMAAAAGALRWHKQQPDQSDVVAAVSPPKEVSAPPKAPPEPVTPPQPPEQPVVVVEPPVATPVTEPVVVAHPPVTSTVTVPTATTPNSPVTTAPETLQPPTTTVKPTPRTSPIDAIVSGVGANPLCKGDCTWGNLNAQGLPMKLADGRKVIQCADATYAATVTSRQDRCWSATNLEPYDPSVTSDK